MRTKLSTFGIFPIVLNSFVYFSLLRLNNSKQSMGFGLVQVRKFGEYKTSRTAMTHTYLALKKYFELSAAFLRLDLN